MQVQGAGVEAPEVVGAALDVANIGYGVDVGAGVLDDNDDAAGVLPPLVAGADAGADVSPTVPSAVVDSAPAVLEALPIGYGVDVGAGVLDDNDDAAGETSGGITPMSSTQMRASATDRLTPRPLLGHRILCCIIRAPDLESSSPPSGALPLHFPPPLLVRRIGDVAQPWRLDVREQLVPPCVCVVCVCSLWRKKKTV